jgi:hypothetical protein
MWLVNKQGDLFNMDWMVGVKVGQNPTTLKWYIRGKDNGLVDIQEYADEASARLEMAAMVEILSKTKTPPVYQLKGEA